RTQAQRILEETVNVAIERYNEVVSPEQSRELLIQRLTEEEQEYEKAKAEYDQFVAQYGRVRFAEEISARERTLAALEARYEELQRNLATTIENLKNWEQRKKEVLP